MRRRVLCVLLLALFASSRPARADHDDPSTDMLLFAGLGMAVPTYFLGVAWHEGSHALVARAMGAEIRQVQLFPSEVNGQFYFGYTRWRGPLTNAQTSWVLLAPKLTDLVLLGGYALLVGLDALPHNEYASLALTVVATGAWVDFTKDVVSTNPANDMMKIHRMAGRRSEWQRLPWRLAQAALSVGAAYFLVRGYDEVFDGESDAVVAPLVAFPF